MRHLNQLVAGPHGFSLFPPPKGVSMRLPTFGRRRPESAEKGREEIGGPPKSHEAVLQQLVNPDRCQSNVGVPAAMFQAVLAINREIIGSDRVTRIEDVLGILGATGGFSCIVAAMNFYETSGQ